VKDSGPVRLSRNTVVIEMFVDQLHKFYQHENELVAFIALAQYRAISTAVKITVEADADATYRHFGGVGGEVVAVQNRPEPAYSTARSVDNLHKDSSHKRGSQISRQPYPTFY